MRLSAAVHRASPPTPRAARGASARRRPIGCVRQLRGDLDTILGKALKKDPAERYASVAEFADDLRRHLEHQPISARPDAIGYRAAKFVRRHRRGVTAGAVAATVLATLVGVLHGAAGRPSAIARDCRRRRPRRSASC